MSEHLDPWEQKMKSKLEGFRSASEANEEKVSAFFDRLETEQDKKLSSPGFSKTYLRIAAAILLALGTVFVLYQVNQIDIVTDNGQQLAVTLPDNSQVQLRYASTLRYNKLSWMLSRNLVLEGEALFQVQKGSAFTVESAAGSTTVLGTTFSIRARAGDYQVKCYEGRVQVNLDKPYLLAAGDAVSKSSKEVINTYEFDRDENNWRQEEVYFENEKLTIVVAELERAFGVEARLDAGLTLDDYDYTGFFPTNNLDLALRLVFEPLDLRGELREQNIVFISKVGN